MIKIEKLVQRTLAQTYLDGHGRDAPETAHAIIAALEAAGLLRDQPMSHEEAVRALR
jgi:hypothetical protein